jgi:hypothetical protein
MGGSLQLQEHRQECLCHTRLLLLTNAKRVAQTLLSVRVGGE